MSYSSVILGDNPVAYWRLGETTGITAADQRGTYPGTYSPNSGGAWTGGTLGQAGALAGDADKAALFGGVNGYMSAPVSLSLTAYSVEFWIRPNSVKNYNQIILANTSFFNGFTFHTTAAGEIYCGNANATNGRFLPTELPAGTLQVGVWQHFVFAQDADGNAKFYKNGTLLASKAMTLGPAWTTFGTYNGGSSNAVDGYLDELAVYAAALSAARIAAHYAAGITPPGNLLMRRRRMSCL